jgi:hypothetical protein
MVAPAPNNRKVAAAIFVLMRISFCGFDAGFGDAGR